MEAELEAGRPATTGRAGPGDRRSPFTWTDVVLASAVALLVTLAGGAALAAAGGRTGFTGWTLLGLLAIGVGGYLLAARLLLARRRAGWADLGLVPVSLRLVAGGVAIGLALRGLTAAVLFGLTSIGVEVGNPQRDLLSLATGAVPRLLAALVLGGLLVPLAEEVFFRGLWYGGLRRHLGGWGPALLSAAVFGLAHGISVVLPVTFALGIVNAILYERTGSLWPAVTVHATNNTVAFLTAAVVM